MADNKVPALTDDDRQKALVRALELRKARSEYLKSFAEGKVTLQELLEAGHTDREVIGRIPVRRVLLQIHGIGDKKADTIMDELQIAKTRRLRGLGARQREALLARLS